MALFKYKNLNSQDAAALVLESQKLAIYSNAKVFMGLPGAQILNWFSNVFTNYHANRIDINIPKGWRELEPAELKLPNSIIDRKGYYTFESPVFGKNTFGMGPQAKILGKFENGKLTKVALSIAGTNDLLDIADYFHINSGKVVPPIEPLLNAIKAYAIENNLSSKDITITGYSLGGALTNLIAKYGDTLSDGFFKDANFLAFASPYIYDNPNAIFNLGFENDAVYRYLGDKSTFAESLADTKPLFANPDKAFNSTADNMVLFDGHYSSIFYTPKFQSIFNKPAWSAHGGAVRSDAYERILKSKFYEYTDTDSAIIIDQLKWTSRWNTWVRDRQSSSEKDYGRSTFIFGNEFNNLLQGGLGGDYIDAGGGNDKIKTGIGADRIEGGTGADTLVLSGRNSDWEAFRLKDGTLFMHAKDKSGLTQAENVEYVEFSSEVLTWTRPYEVKDYGLHDKRFLFKWWNKDMMYSQHLEGTNEKDTLEGKIVFSKAGDDKLTALDSGSLLHAGEGNDILIGRNGNDELFGAEGNDILSGSKGRDLLYGGLGDDMFLFSRGDAGHSTIKDFNRNIGDHDKLIFTQSLFETKEQIFSAMTQKGNDVHLQRYELTLVLENTRLDDFNSYNVGIIA